jgi:hypothetical protein
LRWRSCRFRSGEADLFALYIECAIAEFDLMVATVAIANRDDRRITGDDDAPELRSANLDFKPGCCGDERRRSFDSRRISVEIEGLRKDPFAIGDFGQVSETADEFADLGFCGGTVIGEFAIAQTDASGGM